LAASSFCNGKKYKKIENNNVNNNLALVYDPNKFRRSRTNSNGKQFTYLHDGYSANLGGLF